MTPSHPHHDGEKLPKPSITRRLINRLALSEVRAINEYFELPSRESKDEMIGQIVFRVGTGLEFLVCADGPFPMVRWNEFVVELGGMPQHSFASASNEIAIHLDPVYDELDGDTTVTNLMNSTADMNILASKLGVNALSLREMLRGNDGGTRLSSILKAIREKATARAAAAERHDARVNIRVGSTTINAHAVARISQRSLAIQLQEADSIEIVAGFYDVEFLKNLLAGCSANMIRMMFNGLRGQRLHVQRLALSGLMDLLETTHRTVEVRLSFTSAVLHTKLFLISEAGNTRALLGSAKSASSACFENEEVLLSLPEAGALEGYFESAWKQARQLNELAPPANSLINFFRAGVLYGKPTAHLTTTFDPFHDLLTLMTTDERSLLGGLKFPFSDSIAGVGPFDLILAIGGLTSTDDSEVRDFDGGTEARRNALSIAPWCVETCFGYWVPGKLNAQWQQRLQEASSVSKKNFESLRIRLNKVGKSELLKMYRQYVDEVRNAMASRIARLPALLKKLDRDPFNVCSFEKFHDQVTAHLDDASRVERLAQPFRPCAMPELWDDEEAYSDFRSSFFEYLDHVFQSPRSGAMVGRTILAKVGVTDFVGSDAIWSSLFAKFFEENVWYEDDWINESGQAAD